MSATTRDVRTPGILGEIGVARGAAIAGLIVLAVALQSTLLARLTLLGVRPQLVLVVVVSLAFLDGERVGLVTGFFGGLLIDFLLPGSIIGLTALVYTCIGYGVGLFRQFAPTESVWSPVFGIAMASAMAEFGYAAMAIMLGQPWVSIGFTAKVAGLVVLYNTLMTPFAYPLVKRVADKFRPERVHTWS